MIAPSHPIEIIPIITQQNPLKFKPRAAAREISLDKNDHDD
jgi:hypothetical protein